MKVLIGCEESQAVCIAFREQGFEAYSCDLQDCSGGHPEWHLKMDVFKAIEKVKPVLLIAHPPCTYLAVAGLQYLKTKPGRIEKQIEAGNFAFKVWGSGVEHICIENPIGHLPKYIGKYSQIVRMWQFGHADAHKPTCLWLKNLPPLSPTDIKEPLPSRKYPNGKVLSQWRAKNVSASKRSKTFTGIAHAMATQWGNYLKEKQAA